jgi:protein involved in ribonucleotide reduction
MLVVYDSRTGNVGRFIRKLEMPAMRVGEAAEMDRPFVLVTYTTGFGQVPDRVMRFLEKNRTCLRGVAASGNRNWGGNFAASADRISRLFGVPVLCKFELAGTANDVERFQTGVNRVAAY